MGSTCSSVADGQNRLRVNSLASSVQQPDFKYAMLGLSNSGKTTVLKQIKLNYGSPYTQQEYQSSKWIIHESILNDLTTLLTSNKDVFSDVDQSLLTQLSEHSARRSITPDFGRSLKQAWIDIKTRSVVPQRLTRYDLFYGLEYFLTDIDRISAANYLPSSDDLIRIYVRTMGIVEDVFDTEYGPFTMVGKSLDISLQMTKMQANE